MQVFELDVNIDVRIEGPDVDSIKFRTMKVKVDNDQEKAQSERDSHSKNRGGKN